jgi:GrpB-like predicted nucleotidyltransferase (UPF0157 family)
VSEIVIAAYDRAWPRQFERVRTAVWPALSDIALAIEHVGSTAVPGLAAKPVIDIDVVVPDDMVTAGITRLAAIGYTHRGDLGIPQREAFRAPTDLPRHHLYLCPASSPALANHLAVRDYLRTHDDAAQEYARLKQSLAKGSAGDIDAYVAGKKAFLLGILRALGFPDARLDDIARMNRGA